MNDPTDPLVAAGTESPSLPGLAGQPLVDVAAPASPDEIVLSVATGSAAHLSSFSQFAHQQVREYIQLADQKAGFVFAACTAMIAVLQQSGATAQWLKPLLEWRYPAPIAFVSLFGLAVAAGFAFHAVYPRTPGAFEGLLFWKAIAMRPNPRQYIDRIATATEEALVAEYLTHTYELSKVCDRKYLSLKSAFFFASIGFAAAILYLLTVKPA